MLTAFFISLSAVGVLLVLGFILGKLNIINEAANKVFANLLLTAAMPAALFIAFPNTFDSASLALFLQAAVASSGVLLVAILTAHLLFRRRLQPRTFLQHRFAFIFNNASFLGYPLTLAIFGPSSMIIYSGLMLSFNFALFSYGTWLFTQKISWQNIMQIFLNPNIIAVLLGLIFFLNSWRLPDFLQQSVNYLAALTTPLSLLSIGFMLSQITAWRRFWRKKQIFITCLLQLLLMPTITFLVLTLFGLPTILKQIFTLIQALPTATALAIFTAKYDGNQEEASELVLVSTVASILTLPLIMTLVFWLA